MSALMTTTPGVAEMASELMIDRYVLDMTDRSVSLAISPRTRRLGSRWRSDRLGSGFTDGRLGWTRTGVITGGAGACMGEGAADVRAGGAPWAPWAGDGSAPGVAEWSNGRVRAALAECGAAGSIGDDRNIANSGKCLKS